MPDINELTRRVNQLSGDHMALRAAFESHREHCATDKRDMKTELKAINGKLWAGLFLLALNLLALSAYLAVEGPPWISSAVAEVGKN
jgi:hypothetical protein